LNDNLFNFLSRSQQEESQAQIAPPEVEPAEAKTSQEDLEAVEKA